MFDTTIVIPVHNRAKFIRAALASATDQTVAPKEILVVDDGSSDASADIAEGFGSPVRVIRIGGNGSGPAHPRNVGIRSARTEYVTFLDSDDRIEPKLLEFVEKAVMKCPEFGLVAVNWIMAEMRPGSDELSSMEENIPSTVNVLPKEEILPKIYLIESHQSYTALLNAFYLKMNGITVRKSVLEEAGLFDETLDCGVDLDMWFRILRKRALIYIDHPLQIVVRHANNMSSACNTDSPEKQLRILRTYAGLLEREYKMLQDERVIFDLRCRIAHMHLAQAILFRRQGNIVSACRAINRSLGWGTSPMTALFELMKVFVNAPFRKYRLHSTSGS